MHLDALCPGRDQGNEEEDPYASTELYHTVLYVVVQSQKATQFEIGCLRYYHIIEDFES